MKLALTKTAGQLRATALAAARTHFYALPANGFTWNGTLFQIDAASQARIAAVATMATGAWPAGFAWIATDNTRVPMTAVQFTRFADAVAAYASACALRFRVIKDAIASIADEAGAQAIDVTAGYPSATGSGE
ncbi:MAG TPA: DUF4376 domain-containing protein [Stellaceae bacterium]|nr:DUF4376 domain-containing protein [Stellaceae bacterium]